MFIRLAGVLHRMFNYARKQHGYVNPNRRSPNPIADVERRPEPAGLHHPHRLPSIIAIGLPVRG